MTELIIIISTIISVIFVTLYVILRRNLGNIINQLKNINSTKTNSKILIFSSDKCIRELAIVINKSIEERQKTEIQYKKMEIELKQAVANMSHDLRTPLTSIVGYMQLIEDDTLTDEEKKEYIDIVKKRSQALQDLITSFYDLSRLESKEYKFELKSLNISNIVCDITASFYKNFLDKKIEPVISIDENIQNVIADENAVRRIISNLMQNILRYGTGKVYIYINQHNGYVSTIFTNDAPDLSEEDAAHLFERFFTADRARTGKSTGLGLSIVKQLVEQMGHTISSRLGNGKLSIEIDWKT